MIQNKFSSRMFSYLIINFLLVIVFLSFVPATPVWAQSYEQQYGEELQAVPYVMRVRYAKESGQPWSEATYDERFNYLEVLTREEMAIKLREDQVANNKLAAEIRKESEKEYAKTIEQQKIDRRERAKEYAKMLKDKKEEEDLKVEEVAFLVLKIE